MFKKITAWVYFYRFKKANKKLLYNKAVVKISEIEMQYHAELYLWELLYK